ncbi:MAG TPA: amidohydrolase family protein [Bacteroidota bacterium]|nr:amidohydrolase family protein [Bacteroidota bacterium]
MFNPSPSFSAKGLPVALTVLLWAATMPAGAQVAPAVGIRQNTPEVHAFTNARIVVSPGRVIEKGTLVVRDGMIEAVGAAVKIPADARAWDLVGMTIYPGLIESFSDAGLPKPSPERAGAGGGPGQGGQARRETPAEIRGARYWNANVHSSRRAAEMFMPDPKENEKLRGMGFTVAQIVPAEGVLKGATAVVMLGDDTPGDLLLKDDVAQAATLQPPRGTGEAYPNSLMGAIALIRQTLLDAQWHTAAHRAAKQYPSEPKPEYVTDLAGLGGVIDGTQPLLIDASDEHDLLRSAAIAKEFSLKLWVRGSGREYRRLAAVKAARVPVILPVNFPETPAVGTPEDALNTGLVELRYWDEAPENPKRLADAGVEFAFTAALLKDQTKFIPNVKKAVSRGLSADAALAALTTTPAKLLGIDKETGSLEAGKRANFLVTDGDLFAEKTDVLETWVSGRRYPVKPAPEVDPRGTWAAALSGAQADSLTIMLKGEAESPKITVTVGGKEAKTSSGSFANLLLQVSFSGDSIKFEGVTRMTGTWIGGRFTGTGELSDGRVFKWSAIRTDPFAAEKDTSKPKPPVIASFKPVYPPGEFGRPALPEQPDRLFVKGATIWTSGPSGTIENGDMLVERGRIVKIGRSLTVPSGATVIDAKGKHVTAGMIDCHSHSAAAGSVNETGQAITAEVRIGDVVDPDDIGIYRELAGGLTAANVLHGSANPIGGQNQVIKLRWGALAEEMKFEGAMPGIKFALGENPKGSNWGEAGTRYPQTRSGVEQIIRDEFTAAKDYRRQWADFRAGKSRIPPRRDLQMETLVEILEGKRLVHSHSYRQDEILMLMRVAEDFGFRVATFQHILEGYKVADIMAKHGAGGSSFSDWWAYKMEVYDAIPYNGALMNSAGVVVSFNSDSDELARRMNLEAAKAVKYGGTAPEEALKFVTINPAKQLRIDKRVGSLEPGKDADFVVWSGNPLSTLSICEQTWIDGRRYFDRREDRAMNDEVARERSVLIQKALESPKGASDEKKGGRGPRYYRYEDESDHYSCHDEVHDGEGR